jgi:flagellar biosynthesis/type III secretory pathway M-ring protein FliF/YscJ
MYIKGDYMLEKMKDMWKNLKTSLKIFLIIAACILVYALVNNIFN